MGSPSTATGDWAPFFLSNPWSTLGPWGSDGEKIAVLKPWGDESLVIQIEDDDGEIINCLNNIILPPKFSALYHKDSRALEVIWTTFPVRKSVEDVCTRSFVINHRGNQHDCHFGSSSDRLLLLARHAPPSSASTTNYRNIPAFRAYVLQKDGDKAFDEIQFNEPLSFWVSNVDYDDESLVDLARHLNFYMKYYDESSPTIIIHALGDDTKVADPNRFRLSEFPKHINIKPIDDQLYHIWQASLTGDAVRMFLYNYQIIEYAAFYYVEDKVRREIDKALASPHISSDPSSVRKVVRDAMASYRTKDEHKMLQLFQSTVDHTLVWREIEVNKSFFASDTTFEGGTTVKACIRSTWTEADFTTAIPAFCDAIRLIRNSLSHGKELSAGAIAPNNANMKLLQPWIGPIAAAAREVIIFCSLTQ